MRSAEVPFALVHFPSEPRGPARARPAGGAAGTDPTPRPRSRAGGPGPGRATRPTSTSGLLFRDPVRVLEAREPDDVPRILEEVDRAAAGGLWAVGFVTYEAAPAFDPAMEVRAGATLPPAWFGLFEEFEAVGREPRAPGSCDADSPGDRHADTPARGDAGSPRDGPPAETRSGSPRDARPDLRGPGLPASAWRATQAPERYRRQVRDAQRAIRRGDFYQVNHTMRLRAEAGGDVDLYRRLRASQGTGYHALLHLGRHRVLSVSPELFFRREPFGAPERPDGAPAVGPGARGDRQGSPTRSDLRGIGASPGGRRRPGAPPAGRCEPTGEGGGAARASRTDQGVAHCRPGGWRLLCRPMKGTAPRGRWPEEDDARARRLAGSAKERAENLMIVDLMRNDVSRVARPGTVRVPELFRVERYPTVLQMTSDVTGELDPEVGLADLFAALFPAGSVTGAPKIEAMRHIARAETTPREIYCGTVGVVEPGRRATFNVAIRTLWIDAGAGRAEYGVGGAVTHDSGPEEERAEAVTKAAVLGEARPAFDLLETLRLEDGELVRLDRHMDRLAASARYFGFSPPEEAARAALAAEAERRPAGTHRLRLTAAADGTVEVARRPFPGCGPGPGPRETTPVPAGGPSGRASPPRPVALAGEPVSRENRLLYHKTTHRDPYRRRRARRPDVVDVLLRNEEGELTEFTVGNLVVELEGGLWTPPRDCGLLAGTFRSELVEEGTVGERRLRPRHLEAVDRVWLVNSLRGWIEVRVVDEASATEKRASLGRSPGSGGEAPDGR